MIPLWKYRPEQTTNDRGKEYRQHNAKVFFGQLCRWNN